MTVFRSVELFAILDVLQANRRRLTDGNIKILGGLLFNKIGVATRRSFGREINRERSDYVDEKSKSLDAFAKFSPEPAGSRYALWNHDHLGSA